MNKLVAVALVALVTSVATVGSASAWPEVIYKLPPLFKKAPGTQLEVGEPFQPFAKVADVRQECEDLGGVPVQKFDDAGKLVWVCKH